MDCLSRQVKTLPDPCVVCSTVIFVCYLKFGLATCGFIAVCSFATCGPSVAIFFSVAVLFVVAVVFDLGLAVGLLAVFVLFAIASFDAVSDSGSGRSASDSGSGRPASDASFNTDRPSDSPSRALHGLKKILVCQLVNNAMCLCCFYAAHFFCLLCFFFFRPDQLFGQSSGSAVQ